MKIDWQAKAEGLLFGKKIVGVRWQTDKERPSWWERSAIVLVLDDGTELVASRDDEGNGPGALHGEDARGKRFSLPSCRGNLK